jgi:cytochrome d ubiquinol oxidase subunit I
VVIAVSGMLSGVLVLGVNAWMQLPVGFRMEAGRVVVTDPIAIFKRRAWFDMALYSTLSCYVSVAFAVAAVYAASRLRGRRDAYTRSAILVAMAVGGVTAVLQPLSGDSLAKFVFQTQKAKFAAMEGQFRTQRSAPLRIGGWPDPEARATRWAVEIPGGLSLLATHDPRAEVPGLDQVPRSDWPNVGLTHLVYPDITLQKAAAPAPTIAFMLATLPFGAVLLIPSLWLLFRVFKVPRRAD